MIVGSKLVYNRCCKSKILDSFMSCLDPILTNLEKLTGRGGNLRNGHKFYSQYKKDDDTEMDEEQI